MTHISGFERSQLLLLPEAVASSPDQASEIDDPAPFPHGLKDLPITARGMPFRKAYLRSLIDAVEVDDHIIRIRGSKRSWNAPSC